MPIEQLIDVNIGDLIFLSGKKINGLYPEYHESSGFVIGIKKGHIKLSHDNPLLDKDASRVARGFGDKFPGNRWYELETFEHYEVLRKAKEED